MLTQQPIRRTTSRPGGPPLLAGRSVLCVLPNERLACVVRDALAPATLSFASDGGAALAAMYRTAFEAYVLDYWLPDWTGVSLCRDIRKNDASAPIVFFASASGEEQRLRAMRAGADSYVHVSRGAEALADDVRKFLRRADLRSLAARIEAERAIQEEIQKRAAAAVEASELLRARAAIERTARLRAHKAFLKAGGTLANFERWWPELFGSAVRP